MRMVLIAATLLTGLGPAFAETTVIQRDGPGPDGPGPAARDTTVVRDRDCASKTVHQENDVGDSKTVTKTDCD